MPHARARAPAALFLLALAGCTSTPLPPEAPLPTKHTVVAAAPRPEAVQLTRATVLALAAFDGARTAPEPYRLIGAQHHLIDGKGIWRITFKQEQHLGEHGQIRAAGGEIFVNVDLETEETSVGYGE